jgi:SAM-dependent methyltransferase
MKPTERLSNRAEDYRLHRPGYPAAVIELMRESCGLQGGASVADIGSGTGILTRLLLEAGFEVTAVEPNESMRKAAEQDLRHFARFRSVAAAAEETGLSDGSFDAITVAQAFHWFDPDAARLEFRRLLRPDGWVFIIWNDRQSDASAFARDYEDLLVTLGGADGSAGHRSHHEAAARNLRVLFATGSPQFAQFDNPQTVDWPGLRGRFLSTSYAPAKGDPGHDEYLIRLERIFHKHAAKGHVVFDQKTKVYYAKLR